MRVRKNLNSLKLFLVVATMICVVSGFAQDIMWKKNFGGGTDYYYSVVAVPNGIVAVGSSSAFISGGYYSMDEYARAINDGDWKGIAGNGGTDAIIVKYDNNGNVVWKKYFGGSGYDVYFSVMAISDGIIAVGTATKKWDGDLADIPEKESSDAIIVKYDNDGNIIWKKNFGESSCYTSVTTVSDGIIAVGYKNIVKYDNNGNVIWHKKSVNYLKTITAVSDGIVAVGNDYDIKMGSAVIVKYDHNGNVIWEKNFGGSSTDYFHSVTSVADGIIAVGESSLHSFGNGDWTGVTIKGSWEDAIIVKYDNNGNVMWKKSFGGNESDSYSSVVAIPDGIIAVGKSWGVKATEDWTSVTEGGGAFIVKYNNNGNVLWKKKFDASEYKSVAVTSDGIIAVGHAFVSYFGKGDWKNITKDYDIESDWAIIVKYSNK